MQRDRQAMAMYALGITPLIRTMSMPSAKQVCFANDATAGGQLQQLRTWWDKLTKNNPAFGYHLIISKTWLVVKEENLEDAERVFADTGVHITCTGKRHPGRLPPPLTTTTQCKLPRCKCSICASG